MLNVGIKESNNLKSACGPWAERLLDSESDLEVSLLNLREPQEEKGKLVVAIQSVGCFKHLKCYLFLMILDARNPRKKGHALK